MGRTGSCFDNAAAGSFFAPLKEEIGTRHWPDRTTARAEIFAFVETFYHRRRLRKHPARGYLTPLETRQRHEQEHARAARATSVRHHGESSPAFTAVASGLLGGGTAQAHEVESGTFAFSGDAGEYISAGQSSAYTDGEGSQDGMTVQGYTTGDGAGTGVGVFVDSADGDTWSLHLEAPWGPSQPLVPGTYTGAKTNPAPGEPRIELRGNGRGCLAEGSFPIRSVEFATHGYVKALDASFEQHCPGATESVRGEVRLTNPEPPAETVLGVQVAAGGIADRTTGKAVVQGTVTCNSPVTVTSYGTVSQTVDGSTVRGSYSTNVACVPGDPTPWTAQAAPTGNVPFQRGEATVSARTTGTDPFYGHTVTADHSGLLQLKKK